MHKRFIAQGSLLLALCAFAKPASAFYGTDSAHARISFESKVEYDLPDNPKFRELHARFAIESQLEFAVGWFKSPSFEKRWGKGSLASLGGFDVDNGATILSIKPSKKYKSRLVATYRFDGELLLTPEVLKGKQLREDLPIVLPFSPDDVWDDTSVADDEHNPCTTDEDENETDMFYYWDPDAKGCAVRKHRNLVIDTVARIALLPSTKTTYPDYERLYKKNARGARELKISAFFGVIDHDTKHPMKDDWGKINFEWLKLALIKRGFAISDYAEHFQELPTKPAGTRSPGGWDSYRRYEKWVDGFDGPVHVIVDLLFTETRSASEVDTFRNHWGQATRDSDVIYYDGHSGLGGTLDFTLPGLKNQVEFGRGYQVYFLNACNSRTYYSQLYTEAKGAMNMSIVASGHETTTGDSTDHMESFLFPFLDGKTASWQELLSGLTGSLFSVTGVEASSAPATR